MQSNQQMLTIPSRKNTFAKDISIIFLVAAVLFIPSMPVRELWTPDEPRYMEVAREMVELNDYLVPHLNGDIYMEKPPMFFWLAAGFYKMGFGFNAGRMVAALAALGTMLITYFFALKLFSRTGALFAVAALATSQLFLECKGGLLDPLMMFWVTASLYCGYNALQPDTSRRTLWWLGFYGFMACSILTKGPAGLAQCILVTFVYCTLNYRNLKIKSAAHVWGVILFLAIVFGWVIPAVIAGGEAYRNKILFSQTIDRAVSSYSHRQPFYYFLMMWPAMFLPWALIIPLAIADIAADKDRRKNSYPFVWFVTVFVFFSLISGKRLGYLMPLLPGMAMLTGGYIANGIEKGFRWERLNKALLSTSFIITLAALIAIGCLAIFLPNIIQSEFAQKTEEVQIWLAKTTPQQFMAEIFAPHKILTFVVLLALITAVAVWGLKKSFSQNKTIAFIALAMSFLLLSVFVDVALSPELNRFKSAKTFCADIEPFLVKAENIYLMPNDYSGMYNLYTGRVSMPLLKTPEAAINALTSGRKVAIITRAKGKERFLGTTGGFFTIALDCPVSSNKMELIVNWDPATDKMLPVPPPEEKQKLISELTEQLKVKKKKEN